MELVGELLKTDPGKLALLAIVLLAGCLVLVLKNRGNRRSPLMSLAGMAGGSTDADDIKESVLTGRVDRLEGAVNRLDTAREEARIDSARVQMRLTNLEVGQGEMNRKLDRLLERE